MAKYEGAGVSKMRGRDRAVRRHEMMSFAFWLERNFHLKANPRLDAASQAEVIYANVLARIVELSDDDDRRGESE